MSLGLIFIIAGLAAGFGAFIFAAINMLRGFTSSDPFVGFGGVFKGHIGAMIAMALGGLLLAIGFVLEIVRILAK